MFKSNEIKFGDYFKLPNQGLRSYFGNVVKGQPKIYDTPFAKGESTTKMLDKWDEVLKSIDDEWPSLYEFESDMRSKVGPLSVMLPLADRMDSIEDYYTSVQGTFQPVSERAIKACLHEWSPARGQFMRNRGNTVRLMKKSTNSGSPFFCKRSNVESSAMKARISNRAGLVYQDLTGSNDGFWNACAVLGWRGQEGGLKDEDVKQRVVWMFPFAVNASELQVYQPLIESAQKFNIVPAWVSSDEVDREITLLFDTKDPDDLVVCTDFTKFDQHFNQSLQECARAMLSGIFVGDDFHHWLDETFPVKYMIPLAYDFGKVKYGKHGMGSGSGGTNADETLAHRCLQYEAAQSVGKRLNPHSMCLGDDGVLTYPGITVDDVITSYSSHGLEMNDSKQYASKQDCVYLRRWHHSSYRVGGVCRGVYSTMRALGRLRYTERYYDPDIWSAEMVNLRYLSILENVKYHPLKEQFVKFCMERDKYNLGIDIPGFFDNLSKLSKEATAYMPDFLGYVNTLQAEANGLGIESWWIVNYLKSLA